MKCDRHTLCGGEAFGIFYFAYTGSMMALCKTCPEQMVEQFRCEVTLKKVVDDGEG